MSQALSQRAELRASEASSSSPSPHQSSQQSKSFSNQYRPDSSAPRSIRVGEDRYRPGIRRTSAQPLRATWEPKPEESDDEGSASSPRANRRRKGSKATKLLKTFGWRAYALPVLVVITLLVVMNTATSPAPDGVVASGVQTGSSGVVDVEHAAKPVNLAIPTAELPTGGEFTKAGKGLWHVVPGQGQKVGTGDKLYTYTIEVEDGIDSASYAGDDGFAKAVEGTLSDPRSWTGGGKVSFQRVDASFPAPTFRVSLTTPETAHRPDLCGFQIQYESSCRRKEPTGDRVVINLARWVRGAKAFGPDMGSYRQYAINHEVGHALGNGHVGCSENGVAAPVMMQQTFGVSNDYVAQLNQVDPTNYSAVPADGKICKANAWPNP